MKIESECKMEIVILKQFLFFLALACYACVSARAFISILCVCVFLFGSCEIFLVYVPSWFFFPLLKKIFQFEDDAEIFMKRHIQV